ncbi:putative sterigmatocystin 8-o-methyltransferase protein [Rosellinia necatrix]|uniref:Putative sterigmatocystin 8-o-methyltransferase protein n=1 Tax=Rosellinia necatrix TaxID=77044 RepID=A0A1S7UNK5_ROSNE|nr:putative sterigmatocystin 8-o-methyltransferase protein [Rosellinia necatrix]
MLVQKYDAAALAEGLESLLEDPTFDPETLDHSTRRRLSEAARKLSLATEAPGDTVHRIAHSSFQLPLALIGVETGLFDVLSGLHGATTTNAELAEKTAVNPSLLKRLLRYYQAFGIVSQPDDDLYGANNITRALVTLGGRSALPFIHSTIAPAINALPSFLREEKDKETGSPSSAADLTDAARLPWHRGQGTSEPAFAWIGARPAVLGHFMGWMAGQRDGLPTFLDAAGLDFAAEFAAGAADDTPVFVDVGGSRGHQCAALRRRHPALPGRVVLQDLPASVARAREDPLPGLERVELLAHDFFTPQPLRGARAYYLRNILHDWPADKCVEILRNIVPAMTAESRILVDEMILPEKGTPWRAAQQDFIMGACVAAQERSYGEWVALFDRAGLRIERMVKYTEELSDYLIVLVPK